MVLGLRINLEKIEPILEGVENVELLAFRLCYRVDLLHKDALSAQ